MKIIQDSESDREITDEGQMIEEEDDKISENRQENVNNV